MKRVCVIDGGGAKGIIPFTVIKNIEKEIGKPFCEIFDLVVGSSIGGIIATILSMRNERADMILPYFKDSLRVIFKSRLRIPLLQPKYSMELSSAVLRPYVEGTTLSCAKTKLMFTSVNMVDGKTHYFKSWEKKDGRLSTLSTLNRTYAAPLYFGSIKDKDNNAVWLDGGVSNNCCPLLETYIETLRQGWASQERVHILSLGCGESSYGVPYEEAVRYNNAKQVFYFMDPVNGGLARAVSADTQTEWMKSLERITPNFSFQRIEKYKMNPDIDGMDKIKYLDAYQAIGESLSKQVNYEYLK